MVRAIAGWGPWAVEVLGLSVFGLAWSVVGDVDGLSWAGGMARRIGTYYKKYYFTLVINNRAMRV